MEPLQLLTDLHKDAARQGPGADEATEQAILLAGINRTAPVKIADIGCGTGASTLVLARLLNARITAVDFLPDFLKVLTSRAEDAGLTEKITPMACSMDNLPFAAGDFDIIWSEGAIYNIGFERGVTEWKRHLKPGGILAVSEITWTTDSRPAEIETYWKKEYPEINTASAKIGILEKCGYSPTGFFVLPEYCWLNNYYRPMQERFSSFLEQNRHSESAQTIVTAESREIELYEKFKAYYSYGMYVATKMDL